MRLQPPAIGSQASQSEDIDKMSAREQAGCDSPSQVERLLATVQMGVPPIGLPRRFASSVAQRRPRLFKHVQRFPSLMAIP